MASVRKRDSNWFRRRWLDFRNGHSIYLIFIMTFANFVTIQYSLLIDKIPAINSIFNNIWTFAFVFIAGLCTSWNDNRILAQEESMEGGARSDVQRKRSWC